MSDKHGLSQLPMDLYTLGYIGPCNYRPGLGVLGCVRQTQFYHNYPWTYIPWGIYRSMQLPAWIGGVWVCQTNTVLSQLPMDLYTLGYIGPCNYRPGLGVFGCVRQTQFYYNHRPGLGVFGCVRQTQFYHNHRPGLGVFGCVRQTQFYHNHRPGLGVFGCVSQTQFYHNHRPGLGVFWCVRQTQFYHNHRPGLGVLGGVRQTRFITTTSWWALNPKACGGWRLTYV